MTDAEKAAIAREVLTEFMNYKNSRAETYVDARNFRNTHYPAPRVRATMDVPAATVEWQTSCVRITSKAGNGHAWVDRRDLARLVAFDATVDENGMVEEGLGATSDRQETAVSAPTPSPAPTAAPVTRRWWLVVEPGGYAFANADAQKARDMAEAKDEIVPVIEIAALGQAIDRIAELERELEVTARSRDGWEADAKREIANVEYWMAEATARAKRVVTREEVRTIAEEYARPPFLRVSDAIARALRAIGLEVENG